MNSMLLILMLLAMVASLRCEMEENGMEWRLINQIESFFPLTLCVFGFDVQSRRSLIYSLMSEVSSIAAS